MHESLLKYTGQNKALEEQNEELKLKIAGKDELITHLKQRLKKQEEINADGLKIQENFK